ncbi:hypothetical protein [Symbiobacterium terraclitae]|uniref:hypothetical protein n=1 Tax=Symbiobacterium terraclitae TaxID=557451 RepID=UPI0035B51887
MDLQQAARAYRLAVVAAAEHREAVQIADQTVDQTRAALAAIDPTHPLLQLGPDEIAAATHGLTLHPLQMLVELFLKPEPSPRDVSAASPTSLLLAGSLAVAQSGPQTAPTMEILRRVAALTRGTTLERS